MKSRPPCQICGQSESKYTCSKCMVLYCSIACYKQHKESSCTLSGDRPASSTSTVSAAASSGVVSDHVKNGSLSVNTGSSDSALQLLEEENIPEAEPLRPLTSLKWPYVPEESAYPDPLKRNDPKQLQTHQYEAIATSPAIRAALASHPRLPTLLTSIDKLHGREREDALQRALGVSPLGTTERLQMGADAYPQTDEDVEALRELAEAVEAAVRGGKQDFLGLDWGE